MKGLLLSFGIVFVAVFAVLALPDIGYAQQPLVPCNGPDCKACHLVELGQRTLTWFIGVTIAIIALVFAIGGFKMVISGGNTGAVSSARSMMTNSIIGLVILLTSYLIIDTIMKEVAGGKLGPWNKVECVDTPPVDSCADAENPEACRCEAQGGVLGTDGTCTPGETACAIQALTPITDPLAQQMEGGNTLIWPTNNPMLQRCASKFLALNGGGIITSAYRPQSYQAHLYDIKTKWCDAGGGLKNNTAPECAALKNTVGAEVSKHFGGSWNCGAVAAANSSHGAGTGVDFGNVTPQSPSAIFAASGSCFVFGGYANDPYHYNFKSGCTCN